MVICREMCVRALVHCIRVCNYDGEWYVQLGDIGIHTCGTRSIVCMCVCLFVCVVISGDVQQWCGIKYSCLVT